MSKIVLSVIAISLYFYMSIVQLEQGQYFMSVNYAIIALFLTVYFPTDSQSDGHH